MSLAVLLVCHLKTNNKLCVSDLHQSWTARCHFVCMLFLPTQIFLFHFLLFCFVSIESLWTMAKVQCCTIPMIFVSQLDWSAHLNGLFLCVLAEWWWWLLLYSAVLCSWADSLRFFVAFDSELVDVVFYGAFWISTKVLNDAQGVSV